MAIESMLADLGCEAITAAATIKDAVDQVALRKFDLATLDLNLKGERSYPVADALIARGIPFAFSTGYNCDIISQTIYRDRPVLQKPYLMVTFVATVSRLLDPGATA